MRPGLSNPRPPQPASAEGKSARLEPVAYILEMARLEADQVATASGEASEDLRPARVNFK